MSIFFKIDFYKDQHQVFIAKEKLHMDYIHQFLSHSYRAKEIPIILVQRPVDGSMCFGSYDDDK